VVADSGKLDRGLDEAGKRDSPVFGRGVLQGGQPSGHRGQFDAAFRFCGLDLRETIPIDSERHGGRAVDHRRAPVGEANQDVDGTTQSAVSRIGHTEGECGRDCRIDGIPTRLQDIDGDSARFRIRGRYHSIDRMMCFGFEAVNYRTRTGQLWFVRDRRAGHDDRSRSEKDDRISDDSHLARRYPECSGANSCARSQVITLSRTHFDPFQCRVPKVLARIIYEGPSEAVTAV
jgi:hypothetical protein